MVSSTHDHDQIVVSKETTHASSSNNPYGLSKNDIAESSSAKTYALSKPKDDNLKNKEIVEATVLDNNNELFHVVEQVNTCNTCGDVGWERLLVICGKCKVGAQHTYCMIEKVDKVPDEWSCYDCTEDQDQMREGERNEETNSRKRKAESFIDNIEVAENKRRPGLLNKQNNFILFGIDLNRDLNTHLNKDANTDVKKCPGKDLNTQNNCILFGVDLNKCRSKDLNEDANTYMKKYPGKDLNTQNNCMLFGVDLTKCLSTDLSKDASTDMKKYPGTGIYSNKDDSNNQYRDIDHNRGPNTNMNMDSNMGILLPSSFELGSSSNI